MEQNDNRPLLVVIAGPTAVGKSAVAASCAKEAGGEVVSADSMQVYRGMDIGSAKVSEEEMQGVPHHMIDVCDPTEPMDAARYAEMASECIGEILQRGKIPFLAGGTGFYIQAVVRGTDFNDESGPDLELRKKLAGIAEEQGNEKLYRMLLERDPEAAGEIHRNNVKRVIRALEYVMLTGEKISGHNEKERQRQSPYHTVFFFLDDRRERLYERIERRVDRMIESGLPDEVKRLAGMGLTKNSLSMQGIGYKELLGWLDGEYDFDEAVRLIKRNSRRYAKRQETWFKRTKEARVIMRDDFDDDNEKIVRHILDVIRMQ